MVLNVHRKITVCISIFKGKHYSISKAKYKKNEQIFDGKVADFDKVLSKTHDAIRGLTKGFRRKNLRNHEPETEPVDNIISGIPRNYPLL